MAGRHLDNPFYSNHIFTEYDLQRVTIKWWEYPVLWFLPTLVQLNDGYVFYFKRWASRYYLIRVEEFKIGIG